MVAFDCNYHISSLFLKLIRAIVIWTPMGIQNLNNKEKTKEILAQ